MSRASGVWRRARPRLPGKAAIHLVKDRHDFRDPAGAEPALWSLRLIYLVWRSAMERKLSGGREQHRKDLTMLRRRYGQIRRCDGLVALGHRAAAVAPESAQDDGPAPPAPIFWAFVAAVSSSFHIRAPFSTCASILCCCATQSPKLRACMAPASSTTGASTMSSLQSLERSGSSSS